MILRRRGLESLQFVPRACECRASASGRLGSFRASNTFLLQKVLELMYLGVEFVALAAQALQSLFRRFSALLP